jgi:hypothetical protein
MLKPGDMVKHTLSDEIYLLVGRRYNPRDGRKYTQYQLSQWRAIRLGDMQLRQQLIHASYLKEIE